VQVAASVARRLACRKPLASASRPPPGSAVRQSGDGFASVNAL